ncbi:MAG: hypothetical protein GF401_07790 [Chitinivibrionales bacterium]|nr:hypothetical protein [Chitinivibrionales bacterium]
MAVSEELRNEIEQEAAALSPDKYRRAGMGMNKFIGEYSALLAQADEDRDALVASGFDWSVMEKYRGYLEMLSIAYGERLGVTPDSPEKRSEFDRLLAQAEMDRRRLAVVAGYITEKSDDGRALQNYRNIQKGDGIVDTLTDNIGFVSLIKDFPEYAAEIKPGGVAIDESYMNDAVARAVSLLKQKGYVVQSGVPQNEAVDRKNRLLTLCLNAQSHIKQFAAAAFFDMQDYYNSNYASSYFSGSKNQISQETAVAE